MEVERALKESREAFESGVTRSYSWRMSQLRALKAILIEKEADIFEALKLDLGKHRIEAYRDEVGLMIKSVDNALRNLKKWMAPKKVDLPLLYFPAAGEIVAEPLGVVLIFSTWNFPIGLSFEPLIGAISAGNVVVMKPSELASASSNFLATNLPKYLDNSVKVIEGGPHIGEQLLKHKWDKIFFTGSSRVGRIVMTAAAKHLTPVSLELGGKCPAIIDTLSRARDIEVTINRVAGAKWGLCGGQACIAIDYLLVEEKFAPLLVDRLKAKIKKLYNDPENTARIVHGQHFQRLRDILNDPAVAASVVYGGSSNAEGLLIEPTILLDPPLDSEIMREEIFGPMLPIITLKKIEDSIEFLKARPQPLVIYAFTVDERLKRRIVEETSSGGITFNDAMIQFAADSLPFGGIGESGLGKYHGKYSFDQFSHGKAILRRSFLIEFSFRYPPWSEWKLKLIRYAFRFYYIGILLMFLGLER
ncbi:aldehyde dehydrogenase family 3 member F1-like [Phalaenopsis equestris]|uniref:aldehyde dehydrogenase family 3 member F1-like n=1 Tax=Phalaenopsis equestris TaxID=78828 RepID=UPI0009E4E777|nr:aldehyde dehydrogenase family 3 member F1-like [Phalaenopsis equestris]XP_020592566.1 aldehyde dehydrogenase family 3 member F1-like [Phalaenopsis equestris]